MRHLMAPRGLVAMPAKDPITGVFEIQTIPPQPPPAVKQHHRNFRHFLFGGQSAIKSSVRT
jgi:hypothetical protein